MQIEFVNHASVLISTGECRILCDPWILGKAFDDGWALLSESRFQPADFSRVTHIWFSHEHPDHFSVPSLKSIPKEHLENITILYQQTHDKKVLKYCSKMGFGDVRELPLGERVVLAPDVELICNNHQDGWGGADSWLCVRTPEGAVLNLNDCDVVLPAEAEAISAVVGEVDVLLTQFSYASWQGNVQDVASRLAYAREKLAEVQTQTNVTKARFVIPFASYVWFCHSDNFYLNQDINTIDIVRDFIASDTCAEPVVMYPGDVWSVGDNYNSDEAVHRYMQDYTAVLQTDLNSLPAAQSVPLEELKATCTDFQAKLVEDASLYVVKSFIARLQCDEAHRVGHYARWQRAARLLLASLFPQVDDTTVYLTDYGQAFRFGLAGGLQTASIDRDACDIRTTSDALLYAFKFLFGGQSLAINGRFQEGRTGGQFHFFRFFKLAFRRNEGFVPDLKTLISSLTGRL